MFDGGRLAEGLRLCAECDVLEICSLDAFEWVAWMREGVVGGMVFVGGRVRQVVRRCFTCDAPMYLEPKSSRQFCSQSCARAPTPAEDLAELRTVLEELIEKELAP